MFRIRIKIQEFRRKRCIKRLRRESLFWGCDLSEFSDEDIEKGILRFADIVRNAGIERKKACESLSYVFRLIMKKDKCVKNYNLKS